MLVAAFAFTLHDSLRLSVPRFRGEVLKMRKVKRGQMGAYLCIAQNGVPPSISKRIILTVECECHTVHISGYFRYKRWS